MNRLLKSFVLSAAVAATTLTAMPSAFAQDWRYRDGYRDGGYRHYQDRGRWEDRGRWRDRDRYHHRRDRDRGRDAAVAGIAGLAVGALAGAVISQSNSGDRLISRSDHPTMGYQPAPRYQPAPQVVYRGSIEPWTRDWYRYCENRYRSFNPSDGTFTGYDGIRRFCTAN